jgi:hypothetical protein
MKYYCQLKFNISSYKIFNRNIIKNYNLQFLRENVLINGNLLNNKIKYNFAAI